MMSVQLKSKITLQSKIQEWWFYSEHFAVSLTKFGNLHEKEKKSES